ncbi:ABC transporter permease [Candidatus Bipolaricaulota bacterium]|nr:ABC transporter permease [Candidatus Bipolaricaulota bacterium]
MLAHLAKRLALLLLTILITTVIIFAVTRLLPGDVARVILGREASEEAVSALREELGLDDPAIVQYARWFGGFVGGNWGKAYSTGTSIRPLVMDRLANSLMLAAVALVLAIPFSVMLGVLAGIRQRTVVDAAVSIGALSVVGLPEFVTGVVLIELFAHTLHLLPATSSLSPGASFAEALPFLWLPSLTAMFVLVGYVSRLTRAGVIEQLKRPYIRTAVLKGLPYPVVVVRHLLRNALLPTVTVVAMSVSWLVGGLIVIENVFNYPGVGRLLLFAIDRRDIPLLQAIAVILVVVVVISNAVADLAYGVLDPRTRIR